MSYNYFKKRSVNTNDLPSTNPDDSTYELNEILSKYRGRSHQKIQEWSNPNQGRIERYAMNKPSREEREKPSDSRDKRRKNVEERRQTSQLKYFGENFENNKPHVNIFLNQFRQLLDDPNTSGYLIAKALEILSFYRCKDSEYALVQDFIRSSDLAQEVTSLLLNNTNRVGNITSSLYFMSKFSEDQRQNPPTLDLVKQVHKLRDTCLKKDIVFTLKAMEKLQLQNQEDLILDLVKTLMQQQEDAYDLYLSLKILTIHQVNDQNLIRKIITTAQKKAHELLPIHKALFFHVSSVYGMPNYIIRAFQLTPEESTELTPKVISSLLVLNITTLTAPAYTSPHEPQGECQFR